MSVVAAKGYVASGVWAAVKGSGKPDLTLVVSRRPAAAAGVFTTNRFKAAPVLISARRLAVSGGRAEAIVAISGCANAMTGEEGLRDARAISRRAARLLRIEDCHVLLASTGPIGMRLPVSRVMRGLGKAVRALSDTEAAGLAAARGIMTTDTRPKQAVARFRDGSVSFTVGGIAKGVGMLAPNMATMLAFLTTDAEIVPSRLRHSLAEAAAASFNRVTVDGQTSTNDTAFLLANGAAAVRSLSAQGIRRFKGALAEVCRALAYEMVRDGEGVRCVVEIAVKGARTAGEALKAARSIADSPLVKTMFCGRQPNWGRIAQALGQSGAVFNPDRVRIRVAGEKAVEGGRVIAPHFKVLTGLAEPHVEVEVDLRAGNSRAQVLGCDLTERYVRINAGYLS